jgi:hypothetical protein
LAEATRRTAQRVVRAGKFGWHSNRPHVPVIQINCWKTTLLSHADKI